jgi:hypothetical protein
MRATVNALLCAALAVLVPSQILADDFYIYPAKGQSKEQQGKDKYQCYEWAKQQTGFDPMVRPEATSAPPSQQATSGGAVSGAAKGAAVGAIGGAIGGNAGKGAAIGALAGGVFGGARRRSQAREQQQAEQQWEQQQVANYNNQRAAYDRATKACLTGRGYTIQ